MTAAPVADLLPASPDDRPAPHPAVPEGVAVTFSPAALARARRWATFYPAPDVLLDPHGHFAPQPRDQMTVSVHLYAVTRRHLDGIRPDERAVMARLLTLPQVEECLLTLPQVGVARFPVRAAPTPRNLSPLHPAPPAARMDDLLGHLD